MDNMDNIGNIGNEGSNKLSEIKNGQKHATDISINNNSIGNSKISYNEEFAKLLDSFSCDSYNKTSKLKNIYNLIITILRGIIKGLI